MFPLRDSVLVAFYVTLILQCTVSFTSIRQKRHSIVLNAKASAVKESFGYTFAERTVNNVTLQTGGNATGKPVRTVVSKNPRDWTPYNFKDADGEYDVPFINEAMWYRVSVRRNSEKKLTEILESARDSDARWGSMFEEVFYPVAPIIRMKDKSLIVGYKAMAPGLVYMKTKMDPDLADDIEGMKMVYGFLKNPNNLILPLSRGEGEDIEIMKEKHKAGAQIDPELLLMKKDEYVSVVSGPNKGRYGILQGVKNGKLDVCLRSEYKDSYDEFDINEVRYLAEPPEKKWMLMTPKEALESLMSKDPYNPTVKAFKKNGLLEEILYPDGRPEDKWNQGREQGRSEWGDRKALREDTQGREGGRTVRSIATDKSSKGTEDWGSSSVKSSSSTEDWGKSSASESSKSKTNAFDDSFNIEAWGESLSSAGIKTDFKSKPVERGSEEIKKAEQKVEKAEAGSTEDFDDFIQGLLSDMDEPVTGSGGGKEESEDEVEAPVKKWNNPRQNENSAPVSNSWNNDRNGEKESNSVPAGGKGIVVNGGKREWVPTQNRGQPVKNDDYSSRTPSYDDRSSSSSSSSGSNYDSFGSSQPTRPRPVSKSLSPEAEAGRLDSERILDELLRDLDIEAPKGGGAGKAERDYFDFSVDSDDVKTDKRELRGKNTDWQGQGQMQSRDREEKPFNSFNNNVAPKMEDFASFEQYLDALVSHERSAISGNSKKPVSPSNGRAPEKGGKGASYDVDALDYDLIDFLGGDEGEDRNANSKNIRKGAAPEQNTKVRSWSPKPQPEASFSNNKNENSKEFESEYDDLNSFLDELENSNVLPSKLEKQSSKVEERVVTPSKAVKKAVVDEIVIDKSKSDSSAGYSSLTVVALKGMLKAKGLPVSGAKAELIQRLSSN